MTNELPLNALGISSAATLGVLVRLGVNRLFSPSAGNITSPQSALFNDLPANFLGCFILGFHQSIRHSFPFPDWFNLAVSTGFAGSVTSKLFFLLNIPPRSVQECLTCIFFAIAANSCFFPTSTWITQAFASWHLQLTVLLVAGPRLPALVAIPIGVSMAFFGLTLGKDVGDFLLHILGNKQQQSVSCSEQSVLNVTNQTTPITSRVKQLCSVLALVLAFIVLYGAMVAGAILDSRSFSVSHRRFFWMCGVFAPFGALLRWWLSRFNAKSDRFPLGTFAANMTAMVLDLSIAVVLHVRQEISLAASFVLVAVISGLGGSLSTVSTWVNEATKLRRIWRYVYVLGTISAALILGLIIYGTAFWVS